MITAGWSEAAWYERFAPEPLHMAISVTRTLVNDTQSPIQVLTRLGIP